VRVRARVATYNRSGRNRCSIENASSFCCTCTQSCAATPHSAIVLLTERRPDNSEPGLASRCLLRAGRRRLRLPPGFKHPLCAEPTAEPHRHGCEPLAAASWIAENYHLRGERQKVSISICAIAFSSSKTPTATAASTTASLSPTDRANCSPASSSQATVRLGDCARRNSFHPRSLVTTAYGPEVHPDA